MPICRVINKESCAACRMCSFVAEGYSAPIYNKSMMREKRGKRNS